MQKSITYSNEHFSIVVATFVTPYDVTQCGRNSYFWPRITFMKLDFKISIEYTSLRQKIDFLK